VAGSSALDAPADFVTTFFNGRKQNRADSLALDALIAAADRRKLADKENSSSSSSKHAAAAAAAAQSSSADSSSSSTRVAHKHDFVRVFPRPAGRAELELMAARNQVHTYIHIIHWSFCNKIAVHRVIALVKRSTCVC
jgi:hypothetical protein